MPSTRNRPALLAVLAVAVLVLAWLVVRSAGGSGPDAGQPDARPGAVASSTDPASGLPWIAESALPAQARQTLALIRAGGPYPYPRNDDKTFGNRERLLPREPSGYYREYTVITPGEGDRGARRIITGREGEKYWTADHYDSFSRIREGS
ncbi:guanyl-specific ribonuclease Sa [Terracoccus luteus]|uniref:Guanyl-specific ribonuclease Sa n=1 Tax=Terracoccus luteus TaxID=53356 RepID=A0A495XXV6_9MICO|nr:ribonuclease domain-containing protein [Terracoccus luteus]RKT77546.1 guanyl-specific ribonuclease Sa [Terracoccus luteus]